MTFNTLVSTSQRSLRPFFANSAVKNAVESGKRSTDARAPRALRACDAISNTRAGAFHRDDRRPYRPRAALPASVYKPYPRGHPSRDKRGNLDRRLSLYAPAPPARAVRDRPAEPSSPALPTAPSVQPTRIPTLSIGFYDASFPPEQLNLSYQWMRSRFARLESDGRPITNSP